MRLQAATVAILLTFVGNASAQLGAFEKAKNFREVMGQAHQLVPRAISRAAAQSSCSGSAWEEAKKLVSDAIISAQFYGPLSVQARKEVTDLIIDLGDNAVKSKCYDTARWAFLYVAVSYTSAEDSYLRERARIGLDDVRHQQLLDALDKRR